jgi:hypothetical protein
MLRTIKEWIQSVLAGAILWVASWVSTWAKSEIDYGEYNADSNE